MSEDSEAQIGSPCSLRHHQTNGAVGYCLKCLDCYTCSAMQLELSKHPPNSQIWVCSGCAGRISRTAKQLDIRGVLRGYYTEGMCGHPDCGRFSPILQLVLGPIHQLL